MIADEQAGDAFGSEKPFSVGVEEELFLVDPVTGRQTNASAAVQERLGPVDGKVERELHASQVELITDICSSAGEAAAMLGGLRRAVIGTGAGLLGRARTRRREKESRRSPTRSATSAFATCSATLWPRPWAAFTSTSACPTRTRRSGRSTGCAATSLCCRRWRRTRPFVMVATQALPRRARSRFVAGRVRAYHARCATSRTSKR